MPTSDDTGPLLTGPFAGPQSFAQLVRDALACAAREGWSEMVWSDASFEDWPLREREVIESLLAWSRSGRRLVMLAQRYDAVVRYQPRFVSWRCQWDHIVECRVSQTLDVSDFPSALWSPRWMLHRLEPVRSTGVATYEAQRRVLLKQQLDECLRQSAPGFPVTTLGL